MGPEGVGRFEDGGAALLNILIVEDEPLLASTLKHLIELNPRFQVTGVAGDFAGALEAVEARRPNLALVDLQLANGTSGYAVAAKLQEMEIACLFTTGKAPGFPLPDLALGCLQKPFDEEHLVRALTEAEDILRGRRKLTLRARLPEQLEIYAAEGAEAEAEPEDPWLPPPRRSRTGLKARLSAWFA
jgi:DNA-binding NarL/FixJ family response regulator